jgi:sugar phosphate isomerase/epimerase
MSGDVEAAPPAAPLESLERLCIHTVTTKPWSIEIAVEEYARAGVNGITVWRDKLEGRRPAEVRRRIEEAGLAVVSLCRGGFFPSPEAEERRKALEENRRAVDEAAELGAPSVVLVPGADPRQSLEESRRQIEDALGELAEYAAASEVKLSVEPLHPMYADTRSAINTLEQANDLCETLGHPFVGAAVDVYHLWWDPHLEEEIRRCGRMGKLFAYHVCDWRVPTEDLLTDRGLMGEGCIPLRRIRRRVEQAGFGGHIEVEIFSRRWWSSDQNDFLKRIVEAYREAT